MKKHDKRNKDFSDDEKAESRMELKNKLNFVSDEFSISRLTESLSENNRAINMFPQINQPTLEFKETQQSHHLKLEDDMSLDRYQTEGLTARLSYQERSSSQIFLLQERMEVLAKQVEQRKAEVIAGRKRSQALQKDLEKAQKELEKTYKQLDKTKKDLQRKNEIIQSQSRQLGSLKLKQSNSDYDSRNSYSNSKSLMEESIQNFCPELLSPDQTVKLLNQLLKKVSKSSKMMKSLTSDNATKEILAKINKN